MTHKGQILLNATLQEFLEAFHICITITSTKKVLCNVFNKVEHAKLSSSGRVKEENVLILG